MKVEIKTYTVSDKFSEWMDFYGFELVLEDRTKLRPTDPPWSASIKDALFWNESASKSYKLWGRGDSAEDAVKNLIAKLKGSQMMSPIDIPEISELQWDNPDLKASE